MNKDNLNLYDVVVIGAGIVGSFVAREASKYLLKVALLEANNDVGDGCSGANSAIIHSGYDPLPGTLKAKFNALANPMWDQLSKDLDFHFYRLGSLTIALDEEQLLTLKNLEKRSKENGIEVTLLNKEETLKLEPNINPNVYGSLLAKTCGIVDPFNATVKACENAVDNGVELFLNNKVISIKKINDIFEITTQKDKYYAKNVINCAGNYSDKIASMIEDIDWKIISKKGQYFILDHYKYGLVNHTIFPVPTEKGKGILISPTSSYNYILGPSSDFLEDSFDVSTDYLTLSNIKKQILEMVPTVPFNQVIRVFAGNRPSSTRHDFIIEYSKSDNHFINVAGIESPGFVSSPAIAKYVIEDLLGSVVDLKPNNTFNPKVRKHVTLFDLSIEERIRFVEKNPEYGEIICNCEHISLGEINDCLNRNVAPTTIKGIKKRVRAGFGRCQGGFCQPKIVEILSKHYNCSPLDITLGESDSNILVSKIKETNK